MKFTRPHAARMPDPTAETIRTVQDQQIAELQQAARSTETTGRLLAVQVLSGTGTLTLNKATTRVRVRMQAPGGGGGGAGGGAGGAAGAGGSSGVHLEFRLESASGAPLRGGAFSAPSSGGAAGSSAGGSGGTGSDCTLVLNGQTYAAKGGAGGAGMTSSAGNAFAGANAPASGSGGPAGTIIASTWWPGQPGINIGGAYFFNGAGGSSPFGAGGRLSLTTEAGHDGDVGAGGSGGTAAAAGKAGGAGGAARIVVEEYS